MVGNESFACIEDDWFKSDELHPYHLESDYQLWEREFLNYDNIVNYKDIKKSIRLHIWM